MLIAIAFTSQAQDGKPTVSETLEFLQLKLNRKIVWYTNSTKVTTSSRTEGFIFIFKIDELEFQESS